MASILVDCFIPIILSLVYTTSALAKLMQPSFTLDSFIDLGVGPKHVRATRWSVIVLEGVVALGVLFSETRMGAGILSFVLLLVFSCVLAANMAIGRRPNCACFGSMSKSEIGVGSIARNMVLIALSVMLVIGQS